MSQPQRFDILVVGGGMIGAATALGLANQGWQVGLVDGQPRAQALAPMAAAEKVSDFEPRVSALSLSSQALLETLGVWPSIAANRHCAYQTMAVWDGDGTGRIQFEAAELHARSLGTIVENRSVVRALCEAVRASDVHWFDGASVTALRSEPGLRRVELEDGRILEASLVVASDGAQSRLRQWAGLATREWDYDQQAIVCTVRTTQSHRYTAWQRFSPTGPLAFLPLLNEQKDDHFCSIVWSQDTVEANRLMALDDAQFTEVLAQAIERELGAVEQVSKRIAVPLRQRHAKSYVATDLVLVGDAAHTIHPLAGQGANLGFSDARVLLEELGRARSSGLAPNDPVMLARYQRRRKGENLSMMAAMEGFKHLFASDELPVRWLRNTGMKWLDRLGPIKHRIAAQAMGLNQ